MTFEIPDTRAARAATTVVERLQAAGHEALWAGGCVRDILMGREPADYDVATSALADAVVALFPGAIEVGKSFGVVRVPAGENEWVEVATFREDATYSDGRRPDGVTFSDAEHDAQRRDFTINALFYDPASARLIDYVNGVADLQQRVIRCVGDARTRFEEDHLRLLRAARFAATLGFGIADETARAIRELAPLVTKTSAERIFTELDRTLCESPGAGHAILLMDDLGLLHKLLPEVTAMKGVEQPPEFHPEGDVFEHTVIMLDDMPSPAESLLAWSVLLHDVGKPATARHDDGRWRFNRHATVGAEMAVRILKRLRAPSRLSDGVAACVAGHMRFADVSRMKRSTLRRLVGRPTFETELELHRLDCEGSHGKLDHHELLCHAQEEFENEPVLPPPFVTGRDLLEMGIEQGPDVGRWKQVAYDAQLEGIVDSRESALDWLRRAVADGDGRGKAAG
jgi:poly(A) polymerase